MSKPPPSHYANIGDLGEDLVAQWLKSTGWEILHRRFYCRWGEIDIIAEYHNQQETANQQNANHQNSILAFVEVKTRSAGSWDAGGRNAITAKKQAKLCHTAGIFLAEYPEKADYFCRFDVALVFCQPSSQDRKNTAITSDYLASLSIAGHNFKLLEYITAAFDISTIN
jgi:putative endonuclease